MSSYTLRVKKSRYQSLLGNVKSVMSYISNAYDRAGDGNSISTSYSVGDSSSGYNLINSSREELRNIMLTLRDNVIPWIESKINNLNKEIRDAEVEEALAMED